jgi:hypothetical protein
MTLTEYLDGMRAASTADELETAIQGARKAEPPFKHPFTGPTWSRICNVRREAGRRICASHPNGRFVPSLGDRHLLTICGETYRIGYGQNSAGVRYCWHYAQEFAVEVLTRNGIGVRAAHQIWDVAFDYPHRALGIIDEFFAGKIRDPKLNRMIYSGRCLTGTPVHVNRRAEAPHRSHRPCKCGGMLWDWGAGYSCGFNFINWRCDRCTRLYTLYLSNEGLRQVRQRKAA